jgi:uncharacterized membrane protein YdjX (TVP38/TMEM64 family)
LLAVAVSIATFLVALFLSNSPLFGVTVGLLSGFLVHGEIGAILRPVRRRPRPLAAAWLARPAVRRRVIAIGGLAMATGWMVAAGLTDDLSVESARSMVLDMGAWGPVALVGLSGLAMLVAPIPNGPFAIVAGLVWGTWLGTVYALLGQLLGATLGFYGARLLGRRFMPRLVGKAAAERMDSMSLSMGPQVVFWTRMAPFIPIDFTALASGLTAMPYRIYIVAFMLGSVIPTILIVWLGDSLTQSWTARLVSLGVVCLVMGLISLYYLHRNRSSIPSRHEIRESLRKRFAEDNTGVENGEDASAAG